MAGFNVYVYPNTATTDVQEPTEGLRETLDDIVSNSNVPDYNVEIIDEHPNIEASSIYQMLDPWRRWLQRNGYQGPGSHLLAAEGSGGIAEGAGEAWARPMACVSMLEDFVFSQEVLHNFIDSSLPEVRELGYAQDYEHSLVKVFQGGDVSPMTAGYVQDGHAAAGQCGREEQTQRNVLTPTECTTLANQYSWEEHDGGGGDPPEPGQPTASFGFSPTDPSVDETVTFDASDSSPPEGGRIASYEWDFGDGATATGETVAHRFGSAGEFDVQLTVTADNGETDTATQRVTVSDDGGGRCGAETSTASAQGYLSGGWWGSGSDTYTYTLDTASPCSATVTLDGPSSADFDLYLTLDGRTPTTRDYDEASYSPDSQEEITVELSGDEELGLLVDAYSGSGYYTIAVEELGE